MVHLVAYDLEAPHDTGDDYNRVINALKSTYSTWCHLQKSVWLIATDQDAAQVRDYLKAFMHNSDLLYVARLSGNWASFNIGASRSDWLKGRNF